MRAPGDVRHRLSDRYDTLDDYIADGGGSGLERARELGPRGVIDALVASGLRGRGGAGFPTGTKWRSILEAGDLETGSDRFVLCNAAEGEPATFKDRYLMRRNPYAVLEGVAIALETTGARKAWVGLKDTFTLEIERLTEALSEFEAMAMFEASQVEIFRGPDRYLLGEETGLVGAVEGRGPYPTETRPFMRGPFATASKPNISLVNNVETLANIPSILVNGPDWFRSIGTESSPGTMLFTVAGDVIREGVYELPLGSTLRELIDDHAGGAPGGRDIQAVLPGASNAVITSDMLDITLGFDEFRHRGTGLGAGGFAVYDSSACIVDVARLFSRFLYVESCGQCPACKIHSGAIHDLITSVHDGDADAAGDLGEILVRAGKVTDGQKCALPTGAQLLTLSLIQAFPHEFASHVTNGCPSEREIVLPKLVDYDEDAHRFLYDKRYETESPQWTDQPVPSGDTER